MIWAQGLLSMDTPKIVMDWLMDCYSCSSYSEVLKSKGTDDLGRFVNPYIVWKDASVLKEAKLWIDKMLESPKQDYYSPQGATEENIHIYNPVMLYIIGLKNGATFIKTVSNCDLLYYLAFNAMVSRVCNMKQKGRIGYEGCIRIGEKYYTENDLIGIFMSSDLIDPYTGDALILRDIIEIIDLSRKYHLVELGSIMKGDKEKVSIPIPSSVKTCPLALKRYKLCDYFSKKEELLQTRLVVNGLELNETLGNALDLITLGEDPEYLIRTIS